MFNFDTTYLDLPDRCYARLEPTPVARPELIAFNLDLARELGVDPDDWSADALATMFSGNAMPAGATPLAMAYAGHQFGSFVPQLGDGRALLLGEVVDRAGRRRDIQLKGAGITPFSRGGDGRAALGPVLREYLLSEAMHALGIPTTRALAAVLTGEPVMRDTALPGAVLTRVAASHVRVGTFQYFAARRDTEALQRLADHVIARHYPAAARAEAPSVALVEAVVDAQARLVARWLEVGFIHGVMNTDNMSVAGETIDYGPCAFMDAYAPGTVFSSIDRRGRYAYMNQPPIAAWNLARFAETLLPLVDADPEAAVARLTEVVSGFAGRFEHHWLAGMRAKLGLGTGRAEDAALVQGFLDLLQAAAADYTLSFRALCDAVEEPAAATEGELHRLLGDTPGYADWLEQWRARLDGEPRSGRGRATAMRAVNPLFIPRNHLVEGALAAALERSDFAPFERLLTVLGRPFDAQPDAADLAAAPPPSDTPYRTFCGT
ncbi:protein adenylyltransferase SelO [Wenzhouxiangella sp. XN24]|uniref:protein adenylyltransferase SelO n=1 Tax=Wenzhouxiangella sp. XN24 TaxID=2713569 RepID=UPI0013ED4C65|nr:YdiU family protein [Wenzhouxiangella sp. XN24]NGX15984.1 YdiU family protein [Wenzhouxiangella sp. XN24]